MNSSQIFSHRPPTKATLIHDLPVPTEEELKLHHMALAAAPAPTRRTPSKEEEDPPLPLGDDH